MILNLSRRLLAIVASIILLGIISATIIYSHTRNLKLQSQDRLFISDQKYSFGWLPDNIEAKHSFLLRNMSSSKSITISDVSKSCACTEASLDTNHLAPGASTILHASVTTAWRDAFTVFIGVTWVYNDTTAVHKDDIAMSARIARSLVITPNQFDFGSVSQDSAVRQKEIHLERPDAAPLEQWSAIAVESSSHSIQYSIRKDTDTKWTLILSIDPRNQPIGHQSSVIDVQCMSGGKKVKSYNIPIIAEIVSDIRVDPKSLYLGMISKNATFSKTVTLKTSSKSLEVASIVSPDPQFVTADWKQTTAAETVLTFRFVSSEYQGEKIGNFIINIKDGAKENQLLLPYIGYTQ